MTRRTADDLDPDPAAVGGAMSKWPRRTLAWACRDARVEAVDGHVVDRLLDREAEDLRDLAALAREVGIDPSNVEAHADALDAADAGDVVATLDRAYRDEYGGGAPDGTFGESCPFEESGLDKACWRCPVPGRALAELAESEGRAERGAER